MYIPIFSVTLAVIVSLIGLLLVKKSLSKNTTHLLIAVGAGIMTSISLVHILPEASHEGEYAGIFFFVGFCAVFLLDYLQCTHPHEGHDGEHTHTHEHDHHAKKSIWSFNGLFIHTFFDGVAIIGAFGISHIVGIMVTLGVVLHQIPVSLSLAAIAKDSHFSTKQMYLLFGLFGGSLALGALGLDIFGSENISGTVLAFAGGTLLYVGASDLLPELKHNSKGKLGLVGFFIGGILPVLSLFLIG